LAEAVKFHHAELFLRLGNFPGNGFVTNFTMQNFFSDWGTFPATALLRMASTCEEEVRNETRTENPDAVGRIGHRPVCGGDRWLLRLFL
jgi:hypothetical protein